jgi:hypothetical protein
MNLAGADACAVANHTSLKTSVRVNFDVSAKHRVQNNGALAENTTVHEQ